MHIVRVIPLATMPYNAPAVLDYFWTAPLPEGSCVRITMGRRKLAAVVVETLEVGAAKLALKKASFALRKIDAVITEQPQVTSVQLALARWMSSQYATSLATCLKTVAPAFIGKRGKTITITASPSVRGAADASGGRLVVSQPDTSLKQIRDVVRGTHGQTLIIVPEVSLVSDLCAKLPELEPLAVHSGLQGRQTERVFRAVADGSARVVIGTRIALFLPWHDLQAVVVEDALHEAYKSDMAPRYNAPDVARKLASLTGSTLTWLTPAISTVHHHLITTGSMLREDKKPYWPHVTLVSMAEERKAGNTSIFSRQATEALLDAYESRTPLLILSSRRGYATIARCTACAKSVPCTACSAPMRWHRTSEDMLVCYHCGAFTPVPKQCPTCRAGALRPSGLPGSQKLAEAVNTILDRYGHAKLPIPILDSDLVRTADDERDVLAKYDALEHPVLVASGMVYSHRYSRKFGTVIVPQLDALAYNPDYRTQERLIMQMEKIADFCPQRVIVQSWQDDGGLNDVASRNWDAFYRDDLAFRKTLMWPPFTRIVKLSYRHRDRATATRQAAVARDRMLRAIGHTGARGTKLLGPGPALVERAGGLWTQHIIIKSTLSGSRLSELLSFVPDAWTIDVDPRSIA